MCTAPYRLGLTATPIPEERVVPEIRSCMGRTVCSYSIANFAGVHLAPLKQFTVHVTLTSAEQVQYNAAAAIYKEAIRNFKAQCPGGTWADFTRAALQSHAGRKALAAHRMAAQISSMAEHKHKALRQILADHADQPVLIFTADNRAAYKVSADLLIPAITCDIKAKERESILVAFQSGRIRAVVSAQVLNEGIDLPEVACGVVLGGQGGEREHIQRVGRLLRPRPGKTAVVYEVVVDGTAEVRKSADRRRALAA